MAGRNKIPRELKVQKGTLQKCRDTGLLSNGEILIEAPCSPSWLSEQAQQIYTDTCDDLLTMKMLTKNNVLMIVAYANMFAKYLEIEEHLSATGIMGNIVSFSNNKGEVIKLQRNALEKVGMDSFIQAMKIASEFGLTPASKGRVPRIEKPKQNLIDLFSELKE